jgi:Lipid A core - O-antigen ligase and related enzymes
MKYHNTTNLQPQDLFEPPNRLNAKAPDLATAGQTFALTLFLIYLFVIYSRAVDFVLTGLHIPAILFLMSMAAAFLSGAVPRALNTFTGIMIVAFLGWMCFSVPFSVWKGGSVQVVRNTMMAAAVFFPLAGLGGMSLAAMQRVMRVFGWAFLVFAVLSLFMATFAAQRLALQQGVYANPNDLAQVLLMGLPFWIVSIRQWKGPLYLLGCLGVIPFLISIVKTGSRGGMIAGGAMFLVAFVRSSIATKAKLMIVALVTLVSAFIVLPGEVRYRYLTIFSVTTDNVENESVLASQESAALSAQSRKELLKQSIRLTIKNPLFGVGPGMFPVAMAEEHKKRDEWAPWKVTHNSYTQVSSECGIPALVFYLLILGQTLRLTVRAGRRHMMSRHPVSRSIVEAASAIQISFLGFAVFALFLSIAYQVHVFAFAGLAVLIDRISEKEAAALSKQGISPAVVAAAPQFAAASSPKSVW